MPQAKLRRPKLARPRLLPAKERTASPTDLGDLVALDGAPPTTLAPESDDPEPAATDSLRLDTVYTVTQVNTTLTAHRDVQYEIVLSPDIADISPLTFKTTDPAVYRPFQLGTTFYIALTPADEV